MKINWKLLGISIIVGVVAASLVGLLLDSAMKGFPQSERLVISALILIFCAFFIGSYRFVHANRELFKRKTNFRRRYPRGHFWSPGKFYRTVGDADTEAVIQYVREHRFQQTTLNEFPSGTNHA